MSQRAAVIMAAGQGTRMKSPTPKVLHKVGGRTMLDRAIDAAEAAGCARIVVVCGTHGPAVAEHVRKRLGEGAVAIQDPPLGTAHAVLAAKDALAGFAGEVLVTNADCPLLTAADIAPLFDRRAAGDDLVMLAFEAADPALYGRMIQDADGRLLRIVEARDANAEEKAVRACYSGILCARPGRCSIGWRRSATTTSRPSTTSPASSASPTRPASGSGWPSPPRSRSWAPTTRPGSITDCP